MSIHPTAILNPKASIGKNVTIGPFAVIGPDVEIGDDCHIWPHTVMEYTRLGQGCQVFPQASLGLAPQHLKYKGEPTRLEVGARTVFREGVTAHRGTALDQSVTTIGSDCYFMALSHIAHDCRIGDKVIMANGAQLAGHVHVGESTFISTTVGIHQFVRIGKGAMISGGAMVPLDVAPFCVAQGDRAEVKGLNIVGMRRMGLDRASIQLVKEAYKTMFMNGLTLAEALTKSDLLVGDPHVKVFRDFFLDTKRGYLRPSRSRTVPTDLEETVS